jgi:alanine racemase
MTHLATADEDADFTREQLDRFDEVVRPRRRGDRPKWIHAASSAGLLTCGPRHPRQARLLLTACDPAAGPDARSDRSRVSRPYPALRRSTPARPSLWPALARERKSRIATVPLGYADGVPRTQAMEQRGQLSLHGRRVPVAGPVCMDLTMLDVTDHAGVADGDEVVVFGADPTAWDVADWAGTTVWQVLTGVGLRVPRAYVEDGAIVGVESPYLGQ